MIRALTLSLALLPGTVAAAEYQFCWKGGAGWSMTGRIVFPDAHLGTGLINETHVTGFEITGYLDGAPVGSWTLDPDNPPAYWVLGFDTDTATFPMGGYRNQGSYQAWNMSGAGTGCGNPGFGFNGGNRAQDVCLDGRFIDESGIHPDTPMAVYGPEVDIAAECNGVALIGRLSL